jgi:hypothetical protein
MEERLIVPTQLLFYRPRATIIHDNSLDEQVAKRMQFISSFTDQNATGRSLIVTTLSGAEGRYRKNKSLLSKSASRHGSRLSRTIGPEPCPGPRTTQAT